MWSELNGALDAASKRPTAHPYVLGLRSLFRHLGFEPPDSDFGNPQDEDPGRRAAARENFRRAWELATRPALKSAGWKKFSRGSVAELYVSDGPSRTTEKVWLDPNWQEGAIRVRLYPHPGVSASSLRERLELPGFPFDIEANEATTEPGSPGEPKRAVADVRMAVDVLFAGVSAADEKALRMRDLVLAVLERAG